MIIHGRALRTYIFNSVAGLGGQKIFLIFCGNFINIRPFHYGKKISVLFHEWEGKWSWAVVPIIVTIFGRLPLWVAGGSIRQSALFFNTPFILENLVRLAMVGLLISVVMSLLFLPPRPSSYHRYRYFYMILQWVLLPVSLVFFSALPCLDAVTHLMFGNYLGFNVSAKKRTT
jgi:hypothetical protein